MRQLPLSLVVAAALAALAASAAAVPKADVQVQAEAEVAAPCSDDGLAHIPDLPDGVQKPYSVRKRSRTVHRDPTAVTDDTPQLPPGQRRFDAVLPDEQGHDVSGTPARGQRRLVIREDAVNEVASSEEVAPVRRSARRPVRRQKVVELSGLVAEHNAKSDAVVDSFVKVRKYPTHLPSEDALADDDANLADNDIAGARVLNDQVALEDVPTASTEQRVDADADPDLPAGYKSKFPKLTFASDAGGSGDVLRVKARKRVNSYQPPPPPQHGEQVEDPDAAPAPPQPERRQQQSRPRPRPAPRRPEQQDDTQEPTVPAAPTAPGSGTRGPQSYRASHRVRADGAGAPEGPPPRRQPPRRRPEAAPAPSDADVGVEPSPQDDVADVQDAVQPARSPLPRRRPQPRPQPAAGEDQGPQQQQQLQQRPAPRRRLRPRPEGFRLAEPDVGVAVTTQDSLVLENVVSPTPAPAPAPFADEDQTRPQRRPLRRRLRPRPQVPEEGGADQDAERQSAAPLRRRRPQGQGQGPAPAPRIVTEESFSARSSHADQASQQTAPAAQPPQPRSRGQGRKLAPAPAAQNLPEVPEVQVEHDGTALEQHPHEPTLVRSAVKKVPAGGQGGDPSPALIQKIVKNTLRRLKPQIAEHEGDVGVDILVKIIQVEDR